MPTAAHIELISKRYREAFGASASPAFDQWMHSGATTGAALGYRRAGAAPLFLEAYLDCPIEDLVSAAHGRKVARQAIVEIGNFASDNAIAMIGLWGRAANDLGGAGEVAVATLTAPLRRMFARIGLPITPIAKADLARLANGLTEWGRYYETDPWVCMGVIAEGQAAIAAFLARRQPRAAA